MEYPTTISDFGYLFQYFGAWLHYNFFSIEVTFFGQTLQIGSIFAWVVVGSIFLHFMKIMMGAISE